MNIDYEFIIVSLINAFIIMSAMTNFLLYPLKRVNILVIYLYILTCQLFFAPHFGQTIIIFTIGGTLLIIFFIAPQKIVNIVFALIGYFIAVLVNYLVFVPLSILGISVSDVETGISSLLLLIIYGTITFYITYFLGKYIRNKLLPIRYIFTWKIIILIFLELLSCFIIFAINIVQEERAGYHSDIIYFNIILFVAFFTITLIIFFFCLRTLMKNQELIQLQQEKKNLTDYMCKLEDMYENMKIFKHDYINILSTLQCYIMDTDSKELKDYFRTKILPNTEKLTGINITIGRLSNIKIIEIKGILYSKLILAMNLGLDITLEVKDEIKAISMEMIDLSRVIGIFMDNAIEAATDSVDRKLVVAVIDNTESVTFIISNSTDEISHPLNELYKKNVSSKDRHSGLGLFSVTQILSGYSNIIHTTNYKNIMFTQTLEICHKIDCQ